MDLSGGGGTRGKELLKPEETANPVLQRFYCALGRLSLGMEVKGIEDEVGRAGEGEGPQIERCRRTVFPGKDYQ